MSTPQFERYLGIDYTGAETSDVGLNGLRVFEARPDHAPEEVSPAGTRRKHWSRRHLAEWLAETLQAGPRTLVGIDHGFSFPLAYFDQHQLALDWPGFLDDFHRHWPTDQEGVRVEDVRQGRGGAGLARSGNSRWRRLTEMHCRAKSVFHFDVQGSVAKSTHAGLPWLRFLRQELGKRLHGWPFDGWSPLPTCSVIAEVYPALWSRQYPDEGRNPHQHDAYSVARWMRESDGAGTMAPHWRPDLSPTERQQASVEGWILGLSPRTNDPA